MQTPYLYKSFKFGVELDESWTPDQDGGELALGLELYEQNCSYCHGDVGQGDAGLSLNNRTFLSTASDDFLRYAIARGRRGTSMGAYDTIRTTGRTDGLTNRTQAITMHEQLLLTMMIIIHHLRFEEGGGEVRMGGDVQRKQKPHT